MHVIIGLGNPGRKYEFTRHNIGFRIVDRLAFKKNIPFKSAKGDYYFADAIKDGDRIILVKPATFMNNSGFAVGQVFKYFPIEIKDILIVCDDFNLPFGSIRFRSGGSDGGHNGLKSIIYHLHSNNFDRLRFGIGNDFTDSISFVLSKFSKSEEQKLNDLVEIAAESIECWMDEGINTTMNRYNKMYL